MRRHQKYNLKLLKIAIDAQKNEDCCSRILRIKNGSNPVFEPNILAGVEGLEPSRTVLETVTSFKMQSLKSLYFKAFVGIALLFYQKIMAKLWQQNF